jgi:excisionase family DNA binding protein
VTVKPYSGTNVCSHLCQSTVGSLRLDGPQIDFRGVDEFLTVAEIAERLKLNQQTVRNMIDRRELAAVRIGQRRVRVKQSALDAFIAAGEMPDSEGRGQSARAEDTGAARARLSAALADSNAALVDADDDALACALFEPADAARSLAEALGTQTRSTDRHAPESAGGGDP